jgi:hypothetical protein
MNEMITVKPDLEKLHALGFETMREYKLYLALKKSLRQQVPVGVAS